MCLQLRVSSSLVCLLILAAKQQTEDEIFHFEDYKIEDLDFNPLDFPGKSLQNKVGKTKMILEDVAAWD